MPPLPEGRLALAILAHDRAAMLEAIGGEILPACEALGIEVHVSDNASADRTPEVCAAFARRFPRFHYLRQEPGIRLEQNLMAAMAASRAEYTWLLGDDDCVIPAALEQVAAQLRDRSPSALVVPLGETPGDGRFDLGAPLAPQLAAILREVKPGQDSVTIWRALGKPSGQLPGPASTRLLPKVWRDARALFHDKLYDLPLSTVVYRTRDALAGDYTRYFGTHHPHLGALFDYLAVEQEATGAVEVVGLGAVCSVSLTVTRPSGKDDWSHMVEQLAREGFPRWFELLPPLYAPFLDEARAYHRHIFRHVLATD